MIRFACLLSLLLASSAAMAALPGSTKSSGQAMYKWVDAQGKTHYSSVIPPADSKRHINELTRDGRLLSVSEAEASSEQRALREKKAREAERVAKARQQEDRRFQARTERYGSIGEFEKDIEKTAAGWKEKMEPFSQRLQVVEGHIAANVAANDSKLKLAELRTERDSIISQMVLIKSESDLQMQKMREDLNLWRTRSKKSDK